MNGQERDTVRLLIDHAKRERLERANRPAPAKPAPVMATVHYPPSAAIPFPEPKPPIDDEPLPPAAEFNPVCPSCGDIEDVSVARCEGCGSRLFPAGRCMFCAAKCRGDVCVAHRDLVA